MSPRPLVLTVAAAVAVAACDLKTSSFSTLTLTPILDSTFVGDSLPPRVVTFFNASGQTTNPGPVTWAINPNTVATIDGTTGEIHGVGRGQALVTARYSGAVAPALVVVSRPLDLTLLMDTVYLMPGDTFTIPLAVAHKNPILPGTVGFNASSNTAVYTIDTTTGFVTAQGTPGAAPYVAHAGKGSGMVADTGAVVVMTLADTTGGRLFLTAVGANTRHEGGVAGGLNYARTGGGLAFRLAATFGSPAGPTFEKALLVRPESISAPGAFAIDTINPQEANPVCAPKRVWAFWTGILPAQVAAYSHPATTGGPVGSFSVTRQLAVPGGYAIGGRYAFTAQRGDLYFDSLGVVVIHGTFVAPLVTTQAACVPPP